MPQIRRYIPVKCPACEALTCITKMCYPIAAIRITSIGQYRDIFPSSRPIGIEDFHWMCTNEKYMSSYYHYHGLVAIVVVYDENNKSSYYHYYELGAIMTVVNNETN